MTTARALALLGCHTCGLVSRGGGGAHAAGPRCGTALHVRKPDSLARTWALLIAATVWVMDILSAKIRERIV